MTYIQYDPKKHEGLPLYEIQSREEEGLIAVIAVKSDATDEQAAIMPFYYVVIEEDVK